jgi:hypothetical protein
MIDIDPMLGGGRALILIGDNPYQCEVAPGNDDYLLVALLESVTDPGGTNNNAAPASFNRGTILSVTWDGARHAVTGRRVFRLSSGLPADARPMKD